jgi:hypothetical protein
MGREDDERREIRRERHRRRLGARRPCCPVCGEDEPAALVGTSPTIRCYECLAREAGRSTVEAHHFAGRNNYSLTVPLPGNWHRVVSDDQYNWDPETLRNPSGSPLRAVAASMRGQRDLERVIAERLAPHPEYLERLDVRLTEVHGEKWWEALGIEQPPLR